MDPQTASEAGVQERTVGASSSKTTSVTASASSFTIAGSEGSRSQREPLPSKNSTSGGLSSLSMLVDLLDSASSIGSVHKEEHEGTLAKNRDHGTYGSFSGQRHRQDCFGNFRDEGYRSGGKGQSSRWKSGTGSFGFSEFGRRNPPQTSGGGGDGLHRSFQMYPERALHHTGELSLKGVAGAGRRSTFNRSTLSTPGGPSSSPKTDPATPSKSRVISDRGARTSTAPSSGISPSSCPTPLSSGNTTPSLKCVDSHPVPPVSSEQEVSAPAASVSKPTSSRTPWRPALALDPKTKLCREMKGLLNKLTVENFPIVGDRVTALCANVENIEQLNDLVDLVLDKAFNEPDFSQLYADLCLIMSYASPSFTSSSVATSSKTGQQSVFSSLIVKKWGEKFDKLPLKLELSEEQKATLSLEDQEIQITKMKTRVRGLCVSFGEFLVRRMVGMRGFNLACRVLLADDNPGEHLIEGMCQMLTTAGAYLDSDPVGKRLLENCFGRLQDIQTKGAFSKRIACLVQDLVDARKVQWHRKVHKERAKGLSQIKEDAENADLVGGSVVRAQYGFVVQLGQRSNLLDNAEYAKYMQKKENEYRKRLEEAKSSTLTTSPETTVAATPSKILA